MSYTEINREEDNALRHVLDVVCINCPKEREIRYYQMKKEYDNIKIQSEKLIKETPDEVKETLLIFTKITQRIKDCKEKLNNLKKRLRIAKNTFLSSFEMAESATKNYLKSKECLILMEKISKFVDSIKIVSECIENKNYLTAAYSVNEIRKCLDNDLKDINAIESCKVSFETIINELYNAIIKEISITIFSNVRLWSSSETQYFNNNLPLIPVPSSLKVFDINLPGCSEKIDNLISSLRLINKLKLGISNLVKNYKKEINKIIKEIIINLQNNMINNMEISRSQQISLVYNKNIINKFLLLILERMDIIYDKSQYLSEIFNKNLNEYIIDWKEHATDESVISENDLELLIYNFNQEINFAICNFIKIYLPENLLQNDNTSSNNLNLNILYHVFSLKHKLFDIGRKDNLFKIELPKRKSIIEDIEYEFPIISHPSINYFKYIFILIYSFILLHNEYYDKNTQIKNPLMLYIDNYFNENYIPYFWKYIQNIYKIDYSGIIDKYGGILDYKLQSKTLSKRPIYKICYDFCKCIKYIIKCIIYMPKYSNIFIEKYDIIFKNIYNNIKESISYITVKNGLTIISIQVENKFTTEHMKQLYELFHNEYKYSKNLTDDDLSFLGSIEFSLSKIENKLQLTENHILTINELRDLLILYDNNIWLHIIINDFLNYIDSIGPESPFNYNPKNNLLKNLNIIDIPFVVLNFIDQCINNESKELIKISIESINELCIKCFIIIYFELRFHSAYYLQSLFKEININNESINPDIFRLVEYIYDINKLLTNTLCMKKLNNYLFKTYSIFITEFIITNSSKCQFIKQLSGYIRKSIYVLSNQLLNICDIDNNQLIQLVCFFDYFEMSIDQIVQLVIDDGPIFSYETYSIIINALKDKNISQEYFNTKMKELNRCFA